ncbi:MAG: hypothetical protein ACFE8P_06420, partial [Promethearchaeota archaeon]
QYIIGEYLSREENLESSCLWIQASEQFSKKRIEKIYAPHQSKNTHILSNVFVLPGKNPCKNLIEQQQILNKIVNPRTLLPPDLKYIVIDNISHHLRYEISKTNDVAVIMKMMNQFFEMHLLPLIMYSQREGIVIVFLHEITYVPTLNQEKPFFYKLYDRIDCIHIQLMNSIGKNKFMFIQSDRTIPKSKFSYTLCDSGFQFAS